MKCPKCGAESPNGARMCMMCGTPLPAIKRCPNCGAYMTLDAPKCLKCGKRQNVTSQQISSGVKILSWIGFAAAILLAISYMPSISSIIFILFALLVIPISSIQQSWHNIRVRGAIKGVLLAALFIIGAMAAPETSKPDETVQEDAQVGNSDDAKISDLPAQTDDPVPTLEIDADFDTTNYFKISDAVLFEYGGYLGGEDIITVITVGSVDKSHVKARTENNDSFFFSIVCEFGSEAVVKELKPGDTITIAGTIKEPNEILSSVSFLDSPTVTLENCTIIGLGEIEQDLIDSEPSQREIGAQARQIYEKQLADEEKAKKDEYKSQCVTVNYSDVERNPDNYDGQLIKFSGTVIQVSEGIFDGVTLRVSSGGNVWLVSYTHKDGEPRILENDNITCYGKCTGVSSYTTVLGSQVTIPSLKMEFYD